ncbi:MAG: hypothetical protein COV76_05390 [Candidatus Omnitrophica bacterium CG11_big_fil_rev_8_21_14_0_20_64_10]|nr:MAG: hypothetical protein COV76_05390 [Candidatus Omnitrophica bacterium CG11_big_fil_rev_8_21_14_0_20_64_10]
MKRRELFRLLDANLNRAREGLRVCEEAARLFLDSPRLTRCCQRLRYDLEAAARSLPTREFLRARDSRRDVGRPEERGRVRPHREVFDLLQANGKRVQEALRVLEEFGRLEFPTQSRRFGALRFRAYTLEKELAGALPAVRHR